MRDNGRRSIVLPLASALAAVTLAFPAQAQSGACKPTVESNRQIVLDFYRTGLIELQPRVAFARYMSADFIEHKADVPEGTREAVSTYLAALIKSVPEPRWEVLRTVAEGDLVFLHARFTPAPGAPIYAVADLFRLKNCLIVEHWDVVAGPPEKQLNPHSRF
ncbi:MAG: nuclear transport factor 2 family protein [Pseudomonadota bacterium]